MLNKIQIGKLTKSRLARIKSPNRFSSHISESLYMPQGFPLSDSNPVYLHTSFKIFDQEVKDLVSDNNVKRGRMPSQLWGWGSMKRMIKIHTDLRAECAFCTRLCRENKDEYIYMEVTDSRRNFIKRPSYLGWRDKRGERISTLKFPGNFACFTSLKSCKLLILTGHVPHTVMDDSFSFLWSG